MIWSIYTKTFSQRFHLATIAISCQQVFFVLYLDRLKNAWVEVCASAEENCSQCGQKAEPTLGGEWVVFPCDDHLEGSVLKVIREGEYLGFCEVDIITSNVEGAIFSSDDAGNSGSEGDTQSDNEAPPSNGDDGGLNPLDLITTE